MNQIYTERILYNIPYWGKIFLLSNEYAPVQTKFLLIKLSRQTLDDVMDSINLTFQCCAYHYMFSSFEYDSKLHPYTKTF